MSEQYELTIDELNEKIRKYEGQIKALRTEIEQDTVMVGACRDEINDLRKCLEEKLEKEADIQIAQPEQRWIPVSERMPEPYTPVLISAVEGDHYIVECGMTRNIGIIHQKPEWITADFGFPVKVVAWMPLPEPWKGD